MRTVSKWLLVAVMALLPASVVSAVEMKLHFPQKRSAFQTNERIDVSVIRSNEGDLPAGNLTLVLANEGSKMTFVFGLKAAPARMTTVKVKAEDGSESTVEKNLASATDHLHLNGWLIAPGKYTLTATLGDATDQADIEVFSHIRRSTYKTIHWWAPNGEKLKGEGDDGMGYNLAFGGIDETSIREKMDTMGIMAMGGMHQHDGNLECDWSDPYVYIGSIQRAMDRGLAFRTMPNMIGVHLHDEPGLTWNPHPFMKDEKGEPKMSQHDIKSQRAAYFRAFDKEQPYVNEVDVSDPEQLAAWTQMSEFKLGYMEAFWRASRDAVERIKPGALAVTQTIYGWHYPFDGYYFNIARSMPVVSGHGGYNDYWMRNFNPSFYLEFSLPRQLDKPTWYLPEWYDMSSAAYKFEHYMSFITGIQGLVFPPCAGTGNRGKEGITEANRTIGRLGTIFVKPAYTRQPVAILYSKSDFMSRKWVNQANHLGFVYMASKMIQQPMNVVLEEDLLDGTVAAGHKAIIISGVVYLDPAVIAALTDFAKNGGLVLVGDEVKIDIPGATKLGMEIRNIGDDLNKAWQAELEKQGLKGSKEKEDQEKASALGAQMTGWLAMVKATEPLAAALKAKLDAAKIAPVFGSDNPLIAPGRQVRGEIEYLFAVNFAMKMEGRSWSGEPIPTTATLTLADDGRPIYDAMAGKDATATFAKGNGGVSAKLDFEAGGMKAFARTARPIGGVLVAAPTVNFDLTREGQPPIQLEIAATLVDKNNKLIAGTAPMQIVVKDPAGNVRYDLYRPTDLGLCSLTLPMAANDPAGKWTVTVTDLLAGTTGTASFEFTPLTRVRSMAGATHRAVFFGDDKANIYRFFRDHRVVTIAIGTSDYNQAAADRLVKILKPYNITATIVKANEVPARELSEEEARTWCGTGVSGAKSGVKPGRANSPNAVGWDLPHPTIVLGTPDDNVMLKHMAANRVFPYTVSPTFPGRGNGMVAWNLFSLGHDVHALMCIAYDAEGMSQAVGTLFELGVGIDPLFPLALPTSGVVEMAK